MNSTIYYLPIKSANLAHYFAKGCICPTKYIENRIEDIQNRFDNQLLFSNKQFTKDTNCSLEIVLNNKEEKVNKIRAHFFLFNNPLPISRIKKIFFLEEQQKVDTIFGIESGVAFLPTELIEVKSNSGNHIIELTELENAKDIKKSDTDWKPKIDKYNKIMGGFAIMSIAGNGIQNYPLNYFGVLSNINTKIKDEIKDEIIKQNIEIKTNKYKQIIFNDDKSNPYNAIYSIISNDVVESFAKEDGIELPKKHGMYLLDKIDNSKKIYLLAILASYGENQGARMKLDDFISDLVSNKFIEEKKEGIALTFGINKGYKSFRNSYKISKFKIDVKFKLDSKLDYYTIESIYQFVFNGKKDNSIFEYIDDWCPKLNENDNIEGIETYKVLDKIVRYKKKEESLFEKIVSEIRKWLPSYIKIDLEESVKHFKDLFESVIKLINDSVKDKMETLKNEISNLKKTIKERDDIITKLQNEKKEPETEKLEKENVKPSDPVTDPKTEDNESNTVADNSLNRDKRESDLKSYNITKLKKIAKGLKIKNISKYKKEEKDDLIEQILSAEEAKFDL